jgi:hypothetical protein
MSSPLWNIIVADWVSFDIGEALLGVFDGGAVGVLVGGTVGVLVGGTVGGIFVCVGIGVLTADFVLAGKGVSVGCGAAIAELSAVSATVSAADGAQEANTKARTKTPRRNHRVLIE